MLVAIILIVILLGFFGALMFAHGLGNTIRCHDYGYSTDSWYKIEMIVGAAMFVVFWIVTH